jgi:hypothetical protein
MGLDRILAVFLDLGLCLHAVEFWWAGARPLGFFGLVDEEDGTGGGGDMSREQERDLKGGSMVTVGIYVGERRVVLRPSWFSFGWFCDVGITIFFLNSNFQILPLDESTVALRVLHRGGKAI